MSQGLLQDRHVPNGHRGWPKCHRRHWIAGCVRADGNLGVTVSFEVYQSNLNPEANEVICAKARHKNTATTLLCQDSNGNNIVSDADGFVTCCMKLVTFSPWQKERLKLCTNRTNRWNAAEGCKYSFQLWGETKRINFWINIVVKNGDRQYPEGIYSAERANKSPEFLFLRMSSSVVSNVAFPQSNVFHFYRQSLVYFH